MNNINNNKNEVTNETINNSEIIDESNININNTNNNNTNKSDDDDNNDDDDDDNNSGVFYVSRNENLNRSLKIKNRIISNQFINNNNQNYYNNYNNNTNKYI